MKLYSLTTRRAVTTSPKPFTAAGADVEILGTTALALARLLVGIPGDPVMI